MRNSRLPQRPGAWITTAFVALCLAGCMEAQQRAAVPGSPSGGDYDSAGAMPAKMEGLAAASGETADGEVSTVVSAEPSTAPTVGGLPRKIIYNGEFHLVTPDLAQAGQKLIGLIRRYGGFVAAKEISGVSGQTRTGHWQVRIPVRNFQRFMDSVGTVAEVESSSIDSQDVTEEFTDLTAQLRNKRVEEARLIDHLKRSTARLKDILDVEKEISRVRGEIEQMEGRLRYLTHYTDMSTVQVYIREANRFEHPQATTFSAEINRTLTSSWDRLVDVGKACVLGLVSIVPWLPLWLILVLFCLPLLRRIRARLPIGKSLPKEPAS